MHQRLAVQHRAIQRAFDRVHAARYVQVHMHPLPRVHPSAPLCGAGVQQWGVPQRAQHHRASPQTGQWRWRLHIVQALAAHDARLLRAGDLADQPAQHHPVRRFAPGLDVGRVQHIGERASANRVWRLRPLLDDVAHHLKQNW